MEAREDALAEDITGIKVNTYNSQFYSITVICV